MTSDLSDILQYLRSERGLDFTGYRLSMVERRVSERASAAGCTDLASYRAYLRNDPDEPERLADALTIKVGQFFRDPLTFEYLADRILPRLLRDKMRQGDPTLRVWSAACAFGEEAYSIAILIREALDREDFRPTVHIFATDIDEGALRKAKAGVYPSRSVTEVKYGLLKRYFVALRPGQGPGADQQVDSFQVVPEIRDWVHFSTYDILDRNTFSPPESIFGGFDLLFCRNLLIYLDLNHQDAVMDKLLRSLGPSGYLILGEAEIPTQAYRTCFIRVDGCCHVYQKA